MFKLLRVVQRSVFYNKSYPVAINNSVIKYFSNRINIINISSQKKSDKIIESAEDSGKRKRDNEANTSTE